MSSSEDVGGSQSLNVSSVNAAPGAMSDTLDQTNSNDVDSDTSDSSSDSIDISEQHHVDRIHHHQTVSNLNQTVSEDSNVDVESEEQSTPVNNSLQKFVSLEMVSNVKAVPIGSERDEDSEMSDAHYIEKQVVESFFNVNSSEIQARKELDISKSRNFSRNDNSQFKSSIRHESTLSYARDSFSLPASSFADSTNTDMVLDTVKMTIASVAAGEGDPPKFPSRDHTDRHREEQMTQQFSQSFATKLKKNKVEKSLPASARLPVISSLLAPSSAAFNNKALPGIQHITSHGKSSNVSRTVLPSVAHFLGPAKSPPTVYTSQKSNNEMCATSLPFTSSETMASGHPGTHHQTSFVAHTKPKMATISSSKSKNSRKLVTPAGLRLSMAASEELPDPLPIPQYSEKVIRAKQLGTVTFDRPTVLRETVQFFLQFKHYWSSHDYDRISNLVIELFPEFKDSSDTHGVPASKRIRTDLSMYARNFRRREVSQRKKDKPSSSLVNQKSEPISNDVHESDDKSVLHSPSPLNSGGGGGPVLGNVGNPSDFCNELLTAAGIIESQNLAGASRNGDVNYVMANNRHVRVTEPDSQAHGTAVQKYEALEEGDKLKGISSNHKPHEDRFDDDKGDTPVHFIYDKDTSREANTAWQMYSEQMAQAIAAGNYGFDSGVADQAIKKDLGTCARNIRRRFPSAKFKPSSSSQKPWNNLHTGLELQNSEASVTSLVPGTAEYVKAFMAAQNRSLSELGMTQRNLGELAVLAGIKQRIEQNPQEVTSLERQYLAQCSSEEQRQTLMASAAFGHDTAAVAALSAFYGLGVDKRGLMSSDYHSTPSLDSQTLVGGDSDASNKHQRRFSQAEIENRLQETEQNHVTLHQEDKSHGISVGVSEKQLVKREPMSPTGEGLKTPSVKHHYQHLSVPSTSTFASSVSSSAHNPVYWDAHAVSDLAGLGMAHTVSHQTATQAHSQAEIQHLPGHDPSAHPPSAEAPMNLTYSESERHMSHKMSADSSPPLEPLSDPAGLAAQIEVATSSSKSHSPRRRASSSPRFSHKEDQSHNSRDQMWFPHATGFKKENQEVVSLPEPLPVPNYSQKIMNARDEGSSLRHRSEIIRETARFFLALKYWWSSADYTRISELVVQQFPDLKDDTAPDIMTSYRRIQRDLSMCARNLRRSKKPRKMREFTAGLTILLDVPKTSHGSKKQVGVLKSSTTISSKLEKRRKKPPATSFNSKKLKPEQASAAVSELGASTEASEEMTAATALLQQQYMRSSSASPYHPSAHLLPSFHLLPSLHTHPSLHEQQMQQQQQQQQHHQELQDSHSIRVEEEHSAKRLIKKEADFHELPDQSHLNGNTLAGSDLESAGEMPTAEAPVERPVAAADDDSHVALRKSGHMKEVGGSVLSEEDCDKVPENHHHHHHAPANSMKVYADPDHGCDLQEKFSALWRKGKFFDASLGVANKKLHVHKLILLAMSPYLQETFKNADPRSQLEVNLPSDTTYETAKAFLRYIYDGVLEVDTSSVRSLHKIATMLQMTKLAQYCQNFAQHLQDEADKASRVAGGEETEVPKISVHLGDLTEIQRQKHLDAQSMQRLREMTGMSSSALHRTSSNQYMPEEQAQLKDEYLTSGDQATMDQSGGASHFLHSDLLAQYHAHVAASSSVQSSSPSLMLSSQDVAAQQMMQPAQPRHSSLPHPSSSSSSVYQHHHQHVAAQTKTSLLHRLTSPDSSAIPPGPTSLDHQQRLALAAYWQAHTLGELMSRNQATGLTSDPSALTSTSELAAIAAAATTSEDTRHLLPNLGHVMKLKSSHSGSHQSKDTGWTCQGGDSSSDHHATMLPETCIPVDMARTQVNSSD